MDRSKDRAKTFYEDAYRHEGFNAQRRYPNEELCRFMGRNFFRIPQKERRHVNILETGCGSGANLWMIAKEGFSAYGVDISSEAINLCQKMLEFYGEKAELRIGSMTELPFQADHFDAVVDVFSSNCLLTDDFTNFLGEVRRILKPKGRFFSYFPSKRSDAFTNPGEAVLLDSSTLNGICRKSSPYCGNAYPFRFIHPEEYRDILEAAGFEVTYLETVSRTYRQGCEYMEFVTVEGMTVD